MDYKGKMYYYKKVLVDCLRREGEDMALSDKRKIKWGVMGTAGIAKSMTIPAMTEADNCELYAIGGRNKEKADKFKEEFGFVKSYGSYDELLNDENVEAVYIALPNNLHKEWTIKAAKAGKHVLCEKPLSKTSEDVKEMIEVCRNEGVCFMEAFAYLHSPLIQKVKSIMDSGEIGDIKFIETTFLTKGYTDNIRIRRETLGGSLYDLGCYNVSLALRLLDKMPDEVKAMGSFTEEKIDDCFMGYMHFDNDVRVSMVAGMCAGTRGDRFFVYGTKGFIEALVPFNAKGRHSIFVTVGDNKREIVIDILDNYMLEAEQLGRCILSGEEPFVSNEFSLKVAKVNDMCLESMGY